MSDTFFNAGYMIFGFLRGVHLAAPVVFQQITTCSGIILAGIGPKTAGQLLDEYGDLDSVLINSQQIKGKVGQTLQDDYRIALMARKLVRLKTDCQLELNLKDFRYRKPA